jgi:pimeloyl-ACP methyl ester carboxylesterase
MNSVWPAAAFQQFYGEVHSPRAAALRHFRRSFPERTLRAGETEWRYRVSGNGPSAFLALPGGEIAYDLGFESALAMGGECRVVYPAYPRVGSIGELADGLCAILDAGQIRQFTILGASFGGGLARFSRSDEYVEMVRHFLDCERVASPR